MKKLICIVFGLSLFASSASALDVGVGVQAGSVGIGLNLSASVTKTVNARLSLTKIDIDDEEDTLTVGDSDEGEIDAELELDYGANALLVDWYVFNGGFHLTAGMMRHTGEVDLSAELTASATFDGVTLNPGDIGTISGEVKLADSYQPYIGIGWGRKAGKNGGFSLTADLGVVLLDPSVSMEATTTGGVAQSDVDDALLKMEEDAEAELDDFEAWPVISVGVNYAF